MSKEKKNTQNEKRKLSRQERKQIDTLIRQAKGDGKPHTAQDSIPFERMYKDGICRLANGGIPSALSLRTSTISLRSRTTKPPFLKPFDMYNPFDASIGVQLSLISRHANKDDWGTVSRLRRRMTTSIVSEQNTPKCLGRSLNAGTTGLSKPSF